jgi:hypothetical protein
MHAAQAWTYAPRRTRFLPLRLAPSRLMAASLTQPPPRGKLSDPVLRWCAATSRSAVGGVRDPLDNRIAPTVRSNRPDSARLHLPEETFTILAWGRQTVLPLPGTAPASVAAADLSASPPEVCWPGSLVTPDQREVCPLSRGMMLPCGATPSRTITARPSLPPSSFTRCPVGLPCGSRSPPPWCTGRGGQRAYHVALLKPRG